MSSEQNLTCCRGILEQHTYRLGALAKQLVARTVHCLLQSILGWCGVLQSTCTVTASVYILSQSGAGTAACVNPTITATCTSCPDPSFVA